MTAEKYRVGASDRLSRVVTFEGGARSGKGTTVRAVSESLKEDGHEVLVIDQGLKFRSLAYTALHSDVDVTDRQEVDMFLLRDKTRDSMMAVLTDIAGMTNEERDALLYTSELSVASAKIGRSDHSHPLAVDLMIDQVDRASARGVDDILIDGRSLERYAIEMQKKRIATHVLSIYFSCDSLVAARRQEKLFTEVSELDEDEKTRLLSTAATIIKRNSDDMNRDVDPLRAPGDAYMFDFMHYNGNEVTVVEEVRKHHRIGVDTTATQSIDSMTGPLIKVVKTLLEDERSRAS